LDSELGDGLGDGLGGRWDAGAVLTMEVIVLGGRGVGSPTNSNTPVRQRQNSSADWGNSRNQGCGIQNSRLESSTGRLRSIPCKWVMNMR
jgi:hypothetical protein